MTRTRIENYDSPIHSILCCAFIPDVTDGIRVPRKSHSKHYKKKRDALESHNRDHSQIRRMVVPSNHRHIPKYAGSPQIVSSVSNSNKAANRFRVDSHKKVDDISTRKCSDSFLVGDESPKNASNGTNRKSSSSKLSTKSSLKIKSTSAGSDEEIPVGENVPHVVTMENIVNNRNALFAELNQGDGVKSHLKHLSKEEKTARRALAKEAQGVVKAKVVSAPRNKKTTTSDVVIKKAPVTTLVADREWELMHHEKDILTITKDQLKFRHSVVIRECDGTTIILEGKCANLLIDNCNNVSVIFNGAMSGCEVIRSVKCNVQVMEGVSPTFTLDRADNLNVYLNEDSKITTSFTYSLSTGINVWFPSTEDPDDMICKPLPDQFKATIKKDEIDANPSDLFMLPQ